MGVVVLLGLAMVALGTLTASVGTVVESSASSADATRVADGFESSFRPHAVGSHTGTVSFADGRIRTVERDVRVLNASGVVERERVNALRFETGDGTRTVTFLGGAIVSRSTGGAYFERPPSVAMTGDGDPQTVVLGITSLSGNVSASATDGTTLTLRSRVTHERRELGTGSFGLAVETDTPGPWERHFHERNATVERRDFDGDGVDSVVVWFPGDRTGHLVVHRLEVRAGA